MQTRTYGWVQNPSSFTNLKKVVQLFNPKTIHYSHLKNELIEKYIYFDDIRKNLQYKFDNNCNSFTYLELVGTSKGKNGKSPKRRPEAVADGLIQISIIPQQASKTGKMWTDNWTADGFLRWAVSLNFVSVNRELDIFTITEKGLIFSKTEDDSEEELEVLRNALLSYPPATQVLSILDQAECYCTKYFIGNQLGFRGEKGFTSYAEDLMFDWLRTASKAEKKKIKQDIEGTSDKYARGICNWLKNVGFVETKQVKKTFDNGTTDGFQGYAINARGKHAFRQSQGSSKNSKIEKYVMWEFLATDGANRDYIRTRRASLINFLHETSSYLKLIKLLNNLGFHDEPEIFEQDIIGLNQFGLRIERTDNKVNLIDLVNLIEIPKLNVTEELKDAASEKKKAEFLRHTELPAKYIELLDIAFDGNRNRDFEMVTAELFKEVYGLNSILLGGGRKPDGLVFTETYGIIVDTKAYSQGYSKSINQADEMIRYIEDNQRRDLERNAIEWWSDFPKTIESNNYYFLWISSKFIGKFQEQLTYTANQTNTKGGALNVEQLLLGANEVLVGHLDIQALPQYFKNEEIKFA